MDLKLRKHFRLSMAAIEKIENRNCDVFPTEADYVDQKILAEETDVIALLNKVTLLLHDVKEILHKMPESSPIPKEEMASDEWEEKFDEEKFDEENFY